MTNDVDGAEELFTVLVNTEGQHSLWPTFREPPNGWKAVRPPGTREQCLAYIEEHWRDIRRAESAPP